MPRVNQCWSLHPDGTLVLQVEQIVAGIIIAERVLCCQGHVLVGPRWDGAGMNRKAAAPSGGETVPRLCTGDMMVAAPVMQLESLGRQGAPRSVHTASPGQTDLGELCRCGHPVQEACSSASAQRQPRFNPESKGCWKACSASKQTQVLESK